MNSNSKKDRIVNYMKLEHVKNVVKNGVYASFCDRMNDPYEYEIIEDKKRYRVCCLSRSFNAKLMWAHYADGHRGCFVHYYLPDYYLDDNSILRRVEYKNYFDRNTMNIADSLYINGPASRFSTK